jgi:hypothetical protein
MVLLGQPIPTSRTTAPINSRRKIIKRGLFLIEVQIELYFLNDHLKEKGDGYELKI